LGLLLFNLPQLVPALCSTGSYDGGSARALWLGLMGVVNGGIGAGGLCAGVWAWIHPWLEYPANRVARPYGVSRAAQVGS
jgi:hypothetical protein